METANPQQAVIRFDGKDPSQYPGRRKWAANRIWKMWKNGTDDETLGSELLGLIIPNSPAWDVVKDISDTTIRSAEGETELWKALDAHYPLETEEDKIGTTLDAQMDMKPERGESTAGFTGRVTTGFQKCANLKTPVKFPENLQGYLLMRYCSLSVERRAMVLTMTMGDYSLQKVVKAMRTLYPTNLPSSSGTRTTLVAETLLNSNEPSSSSGPSPPPPCMETAEPVPLEEVPMEGPMDVETLIADADEERGVMIADSLLDPESVATWLAEEEELIWALVTWQKARASLNAAKLGRRYPTIAKEGKADLQKALQRVRCWNCDLRGHLSKDCPKPKRTDRKPKGLGKGVIKNKVKQ